MSVLKSKRHESTYEYVYCAYQIEVECISFITRLSKRYQRVFEPIIMKLSSELLSNVISANSAYPSDEVRKNYREQCLLAARGANNSLDTHLLMCYHVMLTNPQGCFSNENISSKDAERKLEHMAETIGNLIDKEDALITKMLKNNKIRE